VTRKTREEYRFMKLTKKERKRKVMLSFIAGKRKIYFIYL